MTAVKTSAPNPLKCSHGGQPTCLLQKEEYEELWSFGLTFNDAQDKADWRLRIKWATG